MKVKVLEEDWELFTEATLWNPCFWRWADGGQVRVREICSLCLLAMTL